MVNIEKLSQHIASYLDPEQVNLVRRSYFYAEQAHDGQRRTSGEAYVTHPLQVASILSEMHMDHQSLMAAMLHDVIEDTAINKGALTTQFGETVAELVDGVSKLTQMEFESQAEKEAENFRKMTLAMAKDIRVILVKLSDRLHNMRTLGALRPEKKRRVAKQTLEIYAPIAARLGMNDIRIEFEDLCFQAMHPLRARRLDAALKSVRGGHRKELVDTIRSDIAARLDRDKVEAEVFGREKHLFSIYSKMRSKKKSFKEIMDVHAFRIVVQSVDDCYRALGSIHNLYKPIPGEFKDYIAIPKVNGYQSLHTVLVGLHGKPIEVQIRTQEMDALANQGIAAHWLYKSEDKDLISHARARKWVSGLLEIQQQAGNSLEFIENAKIDLFPDEVYVFTPKGKIVELPAGATAVDFAYAVHTDIGNHCIACRVNDRLAPLSRQLQSGERVVIITSEVAQPNPNWLNFVVSGKARSAIRHYLKNQRHNQSVELGARMLDQALATYKLSLDGLSAEQAKSLLDDCKLETMDALLEEIGLGRRPPQTIAQKLAPVSTGGDDYIGGAPLIIDSADALVISFARCCRPIPGDTIAAHTSAGKGLVVHQESCRNLSEIRNSKPESISPISWAEHVSGEFVVGLRVEVASERGIIANMATRISEQGAGIEKIQVNERDAQNMVIQITLTVSNRTHLANIMRRIRSMHPVLRVSRSKN
ncbi:RelA/SpoT family protein [Halioxenophilus sp. WMMB6]|uniref:RelA/SpoT family protein n=1 Tax=Halioxenophilus sp. WMMB6 TaxID=3073815 RepID=UPI00295EDBB8|nr:RelA/SpoT family protein [Halioxenophilus sp. WMMB6]